MALGKLFKSMFGGGTATETPAADPVEYKGFTIEAAPINEDGKYRVAGFISGELNNEIKRVQFVRADQCNSLDEAVSQAISKGHTIINEQGEALLEKSHL